MRCQVCHRAMATTGRHTIEDEKGTMTITRRRCRPCHETSEEILLSAGYCGPGSTLIRYTVASPVGPRQIAPPLRAAAREGPHAYAPAV